jgi:hypothetical protein
VEIVLGYIMVSMFTRGGYLEIVLRYIMVSRFTGRGCLEVYHGVKVY